MPASRITHQCGRVAPDTVASSGLSSSVRFDSLQSFEEKTLRFPTRRLTTPRQSCVVIFEGFTFDLTSNSTFASSDECGPLQRCCLWHGKPAV